MRFDCITMEKEIAELEAEVAMLRRAVRIAAEAAWGGDPRRTQEINLAVQQAITEAGR